MSDLVNNNVEDEVPTLESIDEEIYSWLYKAIGSVPDIEFAKNNKNGELEYLGYPFRNGLNKNFQHAISDSRREFRIKLNNCSFYSGSKVLWKKSIWSIAAIAFVCAALIAQLIFNIPEVLSVFLNGFLFITLILAIKNINMKCDFLYDEYFFAINKLGHLYDWKKFIENSNRNLEISSKQFIGQTYVDRVRNYFENERASSPEFISINPDNHKIINRVKVSEIINIEIKNTYSHTLIINNLIPFTIGTGIFLGGAIFANSLHMWWIDLIFGIIGSYLIIVICIVMVRWFTTGEPPIFLQTNKINSAEIIVHLKDEKKPIVLAKFDHVDYAVITAKYLTEEISIRLKSN